MWLEMGSDWHAEMSLEYDASNPTCLRGKCIAYNLVDSTCTFNLQSDLHASAMEQQGQALIAQTVAPSLSTSTIMVTVPQGAQPGATLKIATPTGPMNVVVPEGLKEGQQFQVHA